MEVAGFRERNSARLGRKATEQSANLRVFGNWNSWWRTGFRTQILPQRVGDVRGMWDQRLVRLALLQQLRAVYGIKVKGGRRQCDRRKHEAAATETVVSSGEGDLGFKKILKSHTRYQHLLPDHAEMLVLYGSKSECGCV